MYRFNIEKYYQWRREKDKLSDEDLQKLEIFSELYKYDGMNRDEIDYKIILKQWCDYVED
jgi:hypothetical protein